MIIFFFIAIIVFLISLLVCNIILKLLEKALLRAQYDSTTKFRYVISCIITLILGIVVGKTAIGKII